MAMRWRDREAAERFAERRRRENEAPRLTDVVPKLESLRFTVSEYRGQVPLAEAAHTRVIVIANAAALFLFPCLDPACKDGVHDMTRTVCDSLRQGKERFSAEDPCNGQIGSADCARVLKYDATATYST